MTDELDPASPSESEQPQTVDQPVAPDGSPPAPVEAPAAAPAPVAPPPIAGYEPSVPAAPESAPAGSPAAPPLPEPAPGVPPAAPPPVADAAPAVAATPVPAADPPAPAAPRQPMRAGAAIGIAAVLAFVIASFAGLAAGFLGARLATEGTVTAKTAKVTVVPAETSDPAVAAAAAAVPSVVNIEVRGGTTSGGQDGAPQNHPTVPSIGNGSGVAYKSSTDGGTYIITNNHVVEDAKKLTVRDSSGESYPAELVGRDPETDIAVVKVKNEIPGIDLGSSDKLLVGQTVVAIGSPFGLEHSVTAGVVSAIGRSLPDFSASAENAYPLVDVIQTDASINPGNSGGALVTADGRLVGINTAIYSESGASGGIGFAVPVNTAIRVADQLIEGGEIRHPFIGVIGQTVTAELAAQEKLTVEEGAYVADLATGSGAEKAGVRIGDVVTAVDGTPIRTMDDLILQVRRKKVGDAVKLSVLRGNQSLELDVTVGDKPEDYGSVGGSESTTQAPE